MGHVRSTVKDHWFRTTDEVNAFKATLAGELKREPVPGEDYALDEWHDLKALNRSMAKLKTAGFEPADLDLPSAESGSAGSLRETRDRVERQCLVEVLTRHRGNIHPAVIRPQNAQKRRPQPPPGEWR